MAAKQTGSGGAARLRKALAPVASAADRQDAKVRARKPRWLKGARKYQKLSVAHGLKTPKCGILLDPGLGKTSTVLQILYELRKRGMLGPTYCISTLLGAYEVWGDGPNNERDKWEFPFTVSMLHGSKKDERLNDDADIKVLNWDGLDWLAKNWPHKKVLKGGVLIIDESTKGKNPHTIRSTALRFLCQFFERVIILTGTPTPQSMEDLWGQVLYLDGGAALGKYVTQFRNRYFTPGKRIPNPKRKALLAAGVKAAAKMPKFITTEWELRDGAEEEIYDAIKHLVIRFSDKMLGLKEPVVTDMHFDLPADAMDEYLAAEEHAIEVDASGMVRVANAGARTIRQRQITGGGIYCDDPDRDDTEVTRGKRRFRTVHDVKIDVAKDLAEELGGKPVLIGFEFAHERDRLLKAFKGAPYIDGSVGKNRRSQIIAEFNAGEHPVLLAQMGAVAHAANLQSACHNIILYSMTYDLEVYIQFLKRVHRMGQKEVVKIYRLIARDTVDEDMVDIIDSKEKNQRSLLARFEKAARARLRRMVVVKGKRQLRKAA